MAEDTDSPGVVNRYWQFFFGVLIVIISVFVIVQDVQNNKEQDRQHAIDRAQIQEANNQRDCLAKVVKQTNKYLKVRGEISELDSQSKNDYLLKVSFAKNRQEFIALRTKFVRSQHQVDRQRKLHPLPGLPKGKCE